MIILYIKSIHSIHCIIFNIFQYIIIIFIGAIPTNKHQIYNKFYLSV